MNKLFRWLALLLIIPLLTGCLYWVRAYQTYLQMHKFDKHFTIEVSDEFSVYFKDPLMFSDDFISLAKLQPSQKSDRPLPKKWRYLFRQVDQKNKIIQPETLFYFDLHFNKENNLRKWTFSPLFLQIAPAEFLEVSLRSLGTAKINKDKRQLRADTDSLEKIFAELPKKKHVISQLGNPLNIDEREKEKIYQYNFLLETPAIEAGFEQRALCEVKLTFDNESNKLIKMKGRFFGIKISIDYRKFLEDEKEA